MIVCAPGCGASDFMAAAWVRPVRRIKHIFEEIKSSRSQFSRFETDFRSLRVPP
jgi:hypothetical protein